eukprot:12934559-Prorocentrum_lima.AAC.1
MVVLTQPDTFHLFTMPESVPPSLPACHQSLLSLMPEPFHAHSGLVEIGAQFQNVTLETCRPP